MKVKKLDINNFRGFGEATIEFPDSNLAVFIGTNGQGKSSVLDLVAMFLSELLRKVVSDFALRPFLRTTFVLKPGDVNMNQSETVNTINLMTGQQNLFSADGEIEWTNSIQNGSSLLKTNKSKSLKDHALDIKKGVDINSSKSNLPILVFYVAQRLFNNDYSFEITKRNTRSRYPQFGAFDNAFEKTLNNFKGLISWYREEEDIENEQMRRLQNFKYRNPQLEVLRKAILIFFDKLGSDNFSNLRVERSIQNEMHINRGGGSASLVITKNKQDFRLEQLSDGEKMLLMVVCDIARRLSIANPGTDNPLEGTGIVLIDEIELHLHPKWQREVIPALLATFPGIQFIVTTHSPQVLSQVDQSDIFLLKDGEIRPVSSNPKGLDTNAILEEIMDTPKYPKEVDDLVEQLFLKIQERNFDQAQKLRNQIVHKTSSEHPVLRRADALMERLKILSQ